MDTLREVLKNFTFNIIKGFKSQSAMHGNIHEMIENS